MIRIPFEYIFQRKHLPFYSKISGVERGNVASSYLNLRRFYKVQGNLQLIFILFVFQRFTNLSADNNSSLLSNETF